MEKHYETIIIERSEIESKILGLEKKSIIDLRFFLKKKVKFTFCLGNQFRVRRDVVLFSSFIGGRVSYM